MTQHKITSLIATAVCSLMLVSCATQRSVSSGQASHFTPPPPPAASGSEEEALVLSRETQQEPEFFIKEGSGVFLN
ncbi:MAG: hypothetical protein P8166_02385, partial [Candidatus Thiodiazotropha sp.]